MTGSKCVQVKGVMLLWQHNPGKHRTAKPSGKRCLNTIPALYRNFDARTTGNDRRMGDFVNTGR